MPRIPIYTADGRLGGGPASPDASSLAFNPVAGLGAVAEGIGQIGQVSAQFAKKRENDVAQTWGSSTLNEYEQNSAKFLNDAENKDSPTIADDYKTWATAELSRLEKEAPNDLAKKYIRLNGESSLTRKYATALSVGSKNFLNQSIQEVETSTSQIAATYRLDQSIDPGSGSALRDLDASYQRQIESIDSRFKDFAPNVAARNRAYVTEQVALAAGADNPEWAKELVNGSADIDPKSKIRLEAEIDRLSKTSNSVHAGALEVFMEHQLKTAAMDLKPVKMPDISSFEVFGEKKDEMVAKYALQYKAVNDAAILYSGVSDKRADYQKQKADELARTSLVGHESKALLNQAINNAANQQEKDLAGWMSRNNSEVASLLQMSEEIPPPEGPLYRDAAMDAMLRYQGFPPEGASEEEAARYFGVPTTDRTVLPAVVAERFAKELVDAPPQKQSELIDQFYESFGRHAHVAWQDLRRVPAEGKGITTELQVANLIESRTIRANVLGAIKDPNVIKGLTPERLADFNREIIANDELKMFIKERLGDNYQGSPEAGAIENMVTTYAQALSTSNGLSAKKAVNESVTRIIGQNLMMRSVNGQSLSIPIHTSDSGVPRSHQDADNIREHLNRKLADFPVEQIDWNRMATPEYFSRLSKLDLKSLISSQAFLRTEPNGKEVSLYLWQTGGPPIQLTDKNGNPFLFSFDELQQLPKMETEKETILYNRQP